MVFHLGILKQKWLSDLGYVWKSIYGVDAWRGIGYVMTIFLARSEYHSEILTYEAAEIDGANFWQRLRYVTLPMLSRRHHDQPGIWYYIRSEGI